MSADQGTVVTARDVATGQTGSRTIVNDYLLVTDGNAYRHSIQVHRNKDGGWMHVITVKGGGSR